MRPIDRLRSARDARRGGGDADDHALDTELAGLDALDRPIAAHPGLARRTWRGLWPKLAAIAIGVLAWQAVVWSGWKPEYALPGPVAVFGTLADEVNDAGLQEAILITLRRGILGFALAVVIGVLLALAVVRFKPLRTAIGAFISGIQTMPSIAWFPLAILLFQLTEQAILFVVILGAAPSIANGLISGVDQIPRVLLRAANVMGAQRASTTTVTCCCRPPCPRSWPG